MFLASADRRPVEGLVCKEVYNWRVYSPPSSDFGMPNHEFVGPPIIHSGETYAFDYVGATMVFGGDSHSQMRWGHAPQGTPEHSGCGGPD